MTWITWPARFIAFWLWYAWQIVVSSVAVLADNLTPGQRSTPGIAAVDSHCRNDREITLISVLITLTPGTLVIGVGRSDDAPSGGGPDGLTRRLFVHGLYESNADDLRASITDMERRMLNGVRRVGVGS